MAWYNALGNAAKTVGKTIWKPAVIATAFVAGGPVSATAAAGLVSSTSVKTKASDASGITERLGQIVDAGMQGIQASAAKTIGTVDTSLSGSMPVSTGGIPFAWFVGGIVALVVVIFAVRR